MLFNFLSKMFCYMECRLFEEQFKNITGKAVCKVLVKETGNQRYTLLHLNYRIINWKDL